ncbi:MAG: hypothetical protein K0Q70_1569 [Rhodospirillales bacterium]|jgi:hypothetical protein|nr:hypothetical protein [Rhodospirillales bacterium]
MMWLYDIPTWSLGLMVVAATIALTIGGFTLIHRIYPGDRSETSPDMVIAFIGVICAFHSLLLAFSAVLVWQDFQDSEQAVAVEANTIEDIYRDLTIYGGPQAMTAAQTLIEYVRIVVNEEWPLMADGGASEKAQSLVEQVFQQAGALDPKSPREQVIFSEIFRHLNELMNNRHERLQDAQSAMPGLFWVIVLIATALLIAYLGMLPLTGENLLMAGGMAAAMGLIFFFIIAFDHPFAGDAAVQSDPLMEILEHFGGSARTAR